MRPAFSTIRASPPPYYLVELKQTKPLLPYLLYPCYIENAYAEARLKPSLASGSSTASLYLY
jgi:hypothetical protein